MDIVGSVVSLHSIYLSLTVAAASGLGWQLKNWIHERRPKNRLYKLYPLSVELYKVIRKVEQNKGEWRDQQWGDYDVKKLKLQAELEKLRLQCPDDHKEFRTWLVLFMKSSQTKNIAAARKCSSPVKD